MVLHLNFPRKMVCILTIHHKQHSVEFAESPIDCFYQSYVKVYQNVLFQVIHALQSNCLASVHLSRNI